MMSPTEERVLTQALTELLKNQLGTSNTTEDIGADSLPSPDALEGCPKRTLKRPQRYQGYECHSLTEGSTHAPIEPLQKIPEKPTSTAL